MNETILLNRVTYNPQIFGSKPINRGRRLAVKRLTEMIVRFCQQPDSEAA